MSDHSLLSDVTTQTEQELNPRLGQALSNWQAPPAPTSNKMLGRYCQLVRLDVNVHGGDLWEAYAIDSTQRLWDYLPYGPFANKACFFDFIHQKSQANDEHFYAIIDNHTHKSIGFIAYSRIQPAAASIEVAHVCFSPLLQKTTAATEAIFLLLAHSFTLGYRRCEWKCNSLNQGSKKAAKRLGFTYEGCFRQATVIKGHNRDTDWFSIIDGEWPRLQRAYNVWLDKKNFNDKQQIQSLGDCMLVVGE